MGQTYNFTFACNTVIGNQTIATDLPFNPKGYILFGIAGTANATFNLDTGFKFGMCDGTNSFAIGSNCNDNATTSDTGRAYYNLVIVAMSASTPNTVDARASHVDFGTGNDIVINWADAPGSAWIVNGIAFGGDDISIEVKDFTVGSTGSGNKTYSLSNLTTPEMGIFLTPGSSDAIGGSQIHYSNGLGAAISSSKQFVICNASEDGLADTDCWSYANTDACLMALEEDSGAVRYKAEFSSWGTSEFTLNFIDVTGLLTGDVFAGMFFQGGNWDIGNFAKRTSTGDTVVNTDASVDTIKGIMLFSSCQNSSASVNANNRLSIGCASAIDNESGMWYGDQDATAAQVTANRSENTNILITATEASVHGSSTVTGLANISSMGDDTFTLTYTTATAVAATIFYIVVGETVIASTFVAENKAFGNPLNAFSGDYQKPIFGY